VRDAAANGILVRPVTDSEGIQLIEVTAEPMRMAAP